MKKYFFLLTIMLSGMILSGQNCQMYFPAIKGSQRTIMSYDKKDKVNGRIVQRIVDKEVIDNDITLTVAQETYDKKDEKVMDGEFAVSCHDGKFYLDMRNFLDEQMLAAYKDMEIEVDAHDMEFPEDMSPGDALPDASIKVSINSSGMSIMNLTVWITNRKIEARESVTTPAGTFDCLKMSYDTETKMMVKIQAKSIEWFAEDVGAVKSESYNKNGKLEGYSILTEFKTP